MAKDTEITERDTKPLRAGYKYLRVEIPATELKSIKTIYGSGNKSNDWKQERERDDMIREKFLKPLIDEFDVGELSEDRNDAADHLADKAVARANKLTKEGTPTSVNAAFDQLKAKYDKLN